MDPSDRLDQTTLGETLNAACYAIADAISGGSDLTSRDVDRMPDHIFTLAVYAGWLPQPVAPTVTSETATLGRYTVEQAYRDKFLAIIRESLEDLLEIADMERTGPPHFDFNKPRLTAKELIDHHRRQSGDTLEELADAAGVSISTLDRIRQGVICSPDSLRAVANVLGCDWRELNPFHQRASQ